MQGVVTSEIDLFENNLDMLAKAFLKTNTRKRQIRRVKKPRTYKRQKLRSMTLNEIDESVLLAMLSIYDVGESPNLVFKVKPFKDMVHYEKAGMAHKRRKQLDKVEVAFAIQAINTEARGSRNQGGLYYACRKLVGQLYQQYAESAPPLSVEWLGLEGVEEPTPAEAVLLGLCSK